MPNRLHASLPMYDWPEVRSSTDLLWQHLQPALSVISKNLPSELDRSTDPLTLWSDPNLVFSQTCGLPYLRYLQKTVSLLGTPTYRIEGCQGSQYSSRLIANRRDQREMIEDFEGSTFALNGEDSQSGYNAMRFFLSANHSPAPFFSKLIYTGSHRKSASAVAAGDAALCTIDPLSWAMLKQFDHSVVRQLKVIGETPYTPGLPYICASAIVKNGVLEDLQHALIGTFENLPESICKTFHLTGIDTLSLNDYQIICTLQADAENSGHVRLAPD